MTFAHGSKLTEVMRERICFKNCNQQGYLTAWSMFVCETGILSSNFWVDCAPRCWPLCCAFVCLSEVRELTVAGHSKSIEKTLKQRETPGGRDEQKAMLVPQRPPARLKAVLQLLYWATFAKFQSSRQSLANCAEIASRKCWTICAKLF